MVGYGMLRGWDEGYEVPAFGVCVRPGERGRGVGRALLSFALDLARDKGAPEVMLKVHDGNSAARSLYEGFGFTFCERTPDGLQLLGRLRLPGSGS
jgi:ribosomal protein S18 acetylase RimI-like enzyme